MNNSAEKPFPLANLDLNNIINLSDSYKDTQPSMRPKGTTGVYSYYESRKGAKYPFTVLSGIQYLCIEFLCGQVVTQEKLDFATALNTEHFMSDDVFDASIWQNVIDNHGGKLPIRIRALPEGTRVPVGCVMFDIENLGETAFDRAKLKDIVNHLETLLMWAWHTSVMATKSVTIVERIKQLAEICCDDPDMVALFLYHDMGMRGATGFEAAAKGGCSALIATMGTDTKVAIPFAMKYYGADMKTTAKSIPAAEHSVMTARGREGESTVVGEILSKYTSGPIAMPGDSYDIENFIRNIMGVDHYDTIMNREGTFIIRPDSPRFEGDTPEDQVLWIVESLGKIFGYTINSKKYKVLNPKVSTIYADGLKDFNIDDIYDMLMAHGWSIENSAVGQGGGLHQDHSRDTQRVAIKSSAQERDRQWHDVFKDPLDKSKRSKAGKLKVIMLRGVLTTVRQDDKTYYDYEDLLKTIFEYGELVNPITFDEVRANAGVIDVDFVKSVFG